MRSAKQLKDILTYEELKSIEDRAKKALLYNLLAEVGYKVMEMQKLCYTNVELKDRLVAAIRTDKLEIKRFKRKIREMRKENEARAQILFDFCKVESMREKYE